MAHPLWSLVLLAALVLGALIVRHTPTDLERAQADLERANLLDSIAAGAAALVVSRYPGRSWSELVNETVKQIIAAAGAPTQNGSAIERAAARALNALGVRGS